MCLCLGKFWLTPRTKLKPSFWEEGRKSWGPRPRGSRAEGERDDRGIQGPCQPLPGSGNNPEAPLSAPGIRKKNSLFLLRGSHKEQSQADNDSALVGQWFGVVGRLAPGSACTWTTMVIRQPRGWCVAGAVGTQEPKGRAGYSQDQGSDLPWQWCQEGSGGPKVC